MTQRNRVLARIEELLAATAKIPQGRMEEAADLFKELEGHDSEIVRSLIEMRKIAPGLLELLRDGLECELCGNSGDSGDDWESWQGPCPLCAARIANLAEILKVKE